MNLRPLLVATMAVVALTGLALAAEAQLETFLKPEEIINGFDERSAVQGNLVAVTGLLVAAALSVAAGVMARVPWRQRIVPLGTIFVSAYLLVLMMQTAMFNYNANDIDRAAAFAVSPVLFNGEAIPSVYLGPMALIVAASMGLATGASTLLGSAERLTRPRNALMAHMGAFAIAAPFLIILIWGDLQVLMSLPEQDPGALSYMLVLPLSMLAGAGLLVMSGIKTWQLAIASRDGSRGLAAHDAWIAIRRAEWAAIGVIVAVALGAGALAALPLPGLESGRVFGLTARSHAQASLLVLITLLPTMGLQTPVLRVLRSEATLEGRQQEPSRAIFLSYLGTLVAGLIGAGLATLLIPGVLWAWVFAALPTAIFGLVALRPRDGLLPAMMVATLLWAIGNTVTGSFQVVSDSSINYDTAPGLLALWRAAAVLIMAWAVARAARDRIETMGRALAWPLTAGMGAAVALIIFLELPFSAWVIHESAVEYVGIGTVVASQDAPVRAVIHALTGTAAFLTGLGAARLHRPDWFRQRAPAASSAPMAADGQA